MSLIGCPKIELLNDSTTGVYPVSRRSLFKLMKNLKKSSIILTAHRMNEAEGLRDKLTIIINGRFACSGSPSYLKSEYGTGYSINIKHLNQIA
jgi:ABC-type multidrug transport system ATPase subunit